MDNNKHTDWTARVRERMEGRELKPSDALWERIGEALPQAAAPRKVRRLPWGGILGAAAAAALAAVLILRPSGAPEPGRIEVIPDTAPPTTMSERLDDSAMKDVVESPAAVQAAPSTSKGSINREYQAFRSESPERDDEAMEPQVSDNKDVTPSAATTQKSVSTAGTVKPEQAGMTMEEYLSQEQKAIRRHRSLTAAVFASGMPSAAQMQRNIGNGLIDKLQYSDIPRYSYNGSGFISNDIDSIPNHGNAANSTSDSTPYQGGYTKDPESPNGFNPVKYSNDPYNINGSRLNHSRPISAGLALTMPLGDRFFIESGLYWSWLRSTSAMVSDQSLHSLGVPFKLGWSISGPWRTSFSLSAGAKAEKVVYAVRSGVRMKEPGIQLAATGSAALQFDITQHLGLFVAPELSYWFTRTELPTYNTENPFNLSLKAGVNLTLGQQD